MNFLKAVGSVLLKIGVPVVCGIVLGAALLQLVGPARAQGMVCAPTVKMLAVLKEKHGEVPAGGGILTNGWPMLIVARPDGKTFTLLFVRPEGAACIMATGTGFAVAPQEALEKGT